MNQKHHILYLIMLGLPSLTLTACAHTSHGLATSEVPAPEHTAQVAASTSMHDQATKNLNDLIKAAEDGNVVETQRLLTTGVDVNALNVDRKTALIGAAMSGDAKIARMLLEHGAKPDMREPSSGWAALHFAAFFNHVDIIKTLLSHGADINIKNHFGETPLLQATFRGHDEAVKILLAHNADVTPRNDKGFTALKAAKYKRFTTIQKALEKAGAKQ